MKLLMEDKKSPRELENGLGGHKFFTQPSVRLFPVQAGLVSTIGVTFYGCFRMRWTPVGLKLVIHSVSAVDTPGTII